MALDPTFSLASLPPLTVAAVSLRQIPQLAAAIDSNKDRVWAFQLQPDGCTLFTGSRLSGPAGACRQLCALLGTRWLVLDHCSLDALDGAILALQRHGGDGYSCLLEAGAVALAPSAGSCLSGGSCASVQLACIGDQIGVRKTISEPSQLPEVDAARRLVTEMEWLRSLPASAASLFPRLLETTDTKSAVGYATEFVPGYTVAERIVHGRLTAEDASSTLTFALKSLAGQLYTAPPLPGLTGAIEFDYLCRVRRRTRAIQASPDGNCEVMKQLIRADGVVVNGMHCAGLPAVLRILSRAALGAHIRVGQPERVHGDLILDDIVLAGQGVRLLDPNGEAHSRLYDIGKLCLSVTTCYELFKYDLFDCEIELDRVPPRITVDVRAHPAHRTYAELAEQLPAVFAACDLLTGQDHHLTGTGLVILNGLQNLALPAFHLLQHGREQRAAAFLALGLLRITQGLALLDSDHEASLEEACRCVL